MGVSAPARKWTRTGPFRTGDAGMPVLHLTNRPDPPTLWLRDVWRHRETLAMLTRKDFQTRYKRASLGILWAVAVPALQAAVMAVVFSRVIRVGSGAHFAVYVMSGVVAYSYLTASLNPSCSAIVDGANLTDKVWFPRVLLVAVPCFSNIVGLVATLAVLIVVMPFFGAGYGPDLLLLVPAAVFLVAFTTGLAMVLSALHVYFRDVKFLVQAALLVWLYATPILYPQHLLGALAPVAAANPLTGIVGVFHLATLGGGGPTTSDLAVSLAVTSVLLVVGAEAQRRYDRLFVDLL